MGGPDSQHWRVGTIEHLDRRVDVVCRVAFDGVEYVGRLWFIDTDGPAGESGSPDRAAIPGRTRDEVVERARQLTPHELGLRHRRSLAEKRRFLRLRRVTDDILTKIRYMNQIAISMHGGLLDEEGARQELELTEQQLAECVSRLRDAAGVEG